ncbi:sulfate adenylyltransferase subunit CysN [Vibrio genomosp. F10]|uniref:Sulfate adenylyltransferase subunit 1 n=2 Tax=Vibrio genomosp. F10 TaxID=723171 RepID=A0A1B9QZT7_9VIBR|nr:sulfate adenylyltransferase subunit CysN [Vibrio genomosp. F10]OCH77008.1 sulfate adenylyltransferase subunit CysN [Vibrio genomosp. F10]OEE37624.1 sulfate adenylyltransferase subunit CysN [Vibrio genomosp. F10 str. ZF-129]OEE94647.1 sulfate adenylyltransferase subunit CysN [Vibrio genomosp. F10 str. 9ZC157]OEF05213.1 sulfate adenylyltransferase subunit CysN [Vibrio genomosp. F10 str. 9ZB36]OEF05973.1 sulfate adenylyltransferase subunit CysN [Vibrio genomosp. F10 str. 9ZD137]
MNNVIEAQLEELGIEGYLNQHQHKSLLRFLTCGSVDDGKSTLIGRLLHDTHQIYEDQLAAVHNDSQRVGTTGEKPDLALLVDGLQAEREQGITIDVAYRYFSTQKRKFIIADTPGHEQYTRNMATGASTCDVAIILIDARKGILDQTRRHSFISNLIGIKHFVVAVNKMDLVDYSQQTFETIRDDYLAFAENLQGETDIQIVPLSALEGENVASPSQEMTWFEGPTLLHLLETVDVDRSKTEGEFRFPVQYVNRPNLDFRGFAGTISSGIVKVGDEIKALPSGKRSKVARIVTFDGDLEEAQAGLAVTLTLEDEIDISRGDLIVLEQSEVESSNHLAADVVWMTEQPLQPGREYDIKIAGKKTVGRVESIRYQYDINNLSTHSAAELPLNGIGSCEWSFTESVALDSYQACTDTGGFIIIDRLTNVTVGAGLVRESLAQVEQPVSNVSAFEIELNALVRKHFPHWDAKDLSQLLK